MNHEEAIMWADLSINIQKTFQNTATKAGLLLQKGEKDEAMKILDASAELANMNQLNMLGYMLLQQGEAEKAVGFFELNVKRNPEIANMYDSLGEGLRATGDTKKAIKMFNKSLSMDPPANVKQNSIRNLKELGVEVSS
ncbi:MAG TPA: hypothetical protein DDY13_02390 [Cytophagales bacterium]|jgi:tetratricopeptide (TPR) repeat protein|nr:hypothetical protein [Cytophagales bacterium]